MHRTVKDAMKNAVGLSNPLQKNIEDPLADDRRTIQAYSELLGVTLKDATEAQRAYSYFAVKDKSSTAMRQALTPCAPATTAKMVEAITAYSNFNRQNTDQYDNIIKPAMDALVEKLTVDVAAAKDLVYKFEKRERFFVKFLECKGDVEKAKTTCKGLDKAQAYLTKSQQEFETFTSELSAQLGPVLASYQSNLAKHYNVLFTLQKEFFELGYGHIKKVPIC